MEAYRLLVQANESLGEVPSSPPQTSGMHCTVNVLMVCDESMD